MASNKDPSHAHALHPNVTHHNPNSSNNNNNKISSPFFQEITVATSAPLDNRRSSISNNIYTSLALQPNHLHPQQQQQGHEQGYRHHSHAATADSLASLGGCGPGGGGGGEGVFFDNGNDDDNNAEFEVRVIANRTNVGKDNNNNTEDEIHCTQRYEPFDDDNRATPCLATTTTATTSNGAHSPRESQQPLQSSASGAAAVKPKRLQSLDILRGITIIFMVLVNTQGADPFEQLEHSPWFGYTLADWVFPNFIFMVGMAIAIVLSPTKLVALSRSVQEQQQQGAVTSSSFSPSIWRRHEARIKMSLKTVKRSLILFAIGLALNGLEMIGTPAGGWIRIPGVLQRIGFCYLVIALTVLWSPVRILTTPTVSTITATGSSSNEAPNKMDRAHTHPITRAKASRRSSGTTATTLMTVPKTFEPSRRIRIGLPLICTILWFILTYSIQSSATEPIPSCLYPPQATSTSSSSSSSTNNTDIDILPGFAPSRGQLSPPWCTAQSVVDTWLFTRDRDSNDPIFDAEGSLGTLMAIVSGWFGWMVGSMVVEQQRKWKVVVKRVVDQFEEEVKVGEEEEEERERERDRERERERGRRRRREVVDQSPKDISESSSFALEQQQQLPYSTPSTAFSPQTMESIHLPVPPSPSLSPSSSPSTTDELQIRLTTHQRTFLLAHLGEWFMSGICIMFSGTILGWVLPICKGLWSPSFTLYSAGISINVLCILMYLYDVPSSFLPTSSSTSMTTTSTPSLPTKQLTRQPRINNFLHSSFNTLTHLIQKTSQFLTKLLTCYGRNPTLIYILSELVKIILEKIPAHESRHAWVQTVWSYLFFNTFYEVMPPAWASLVFSSVYILVFAPLLWGLDRKGVYLRV
ncbi:MAG: hypothetical protein J3R72DRAFT_460079 [Linnemannia gamsii]|nr:MAG: hypothetical protein J3R72DRAFT_460079 [Linnemannia gamsii]